MSDDFGDFNDLDLEELDRIEAEAYSIAKDPFFTLPPRAKASTSQSFKQRDLFGGKVQEVEKRVVQPVGGNGGKVVTVAKVVAVKKWDRASFAMHGWSKKNAVASKAKAKGKGKAKAYASDEEAWGDEVEDDEEDEEVLLDPDFDPTIEPPDIKWPPDEEQIKTWLYPVQDDKPLRTYQYNIVHSALFENTLVSLPTGLGKTFIAACVMSVLSLRMLCAVTDTMRTGSISIAGIQKAKSSSSLRLDRSSLNKSKPAITSPESPKKTVSN